MSPESLTYRSFVLIMGIAILSIRVSYSQDIEQMYNKAVGYFENENYDSAAIVMEAALDLVELNPGAVDSDSYLTLVMYNGVVWHFIAQYEKAEKYYLQAKSIFENSGRTMEDGYSIDLNNLAKLYDDLGRFEEAEPLYRKVTEIDKIIVGENTHKYAVGISNLAILYYEMGRYSLSEPLCIQALQITEIVEGKNHPQYALYLNVLAQLYVAMGQYEKAESLLIQAIEIYRGLLGEDHALYAKYLNNLAHLYCLTGAYEKADSLYKQSIEITKKQSGEDQPLYAVELNNLAALYIETGQFDVAEPLLKQALTIDRSLFGKNHPACAEVLNNLSRLYLAKGLDEQAICANQEALEIYRYQIEKNTGFLSQKEFIEFLNTFLYHLDCYQSDNYAVFQKNAEAENFAYNIELLRKGVGLQSTIGIKNRLLSSGDTSLTEAFYKLNSIRKEMDKLQTLSPEKRNKDLGQLSAQANDMEKALSLQSNDILRTQQANGLTWENLNQVLHTSEAAIEFSAFNYYQNSKITDSTLYCAIILKSDNSSSQFVFLFEERQLKDALPSSGADFKEINADYQNQELYDLIWKPIDSLLQGQDIKTVYFAPSGLLNRVAMAAIKCPDGKPLSEKYNLVQLSSTRTLAMPEEPAAITDAVIYGGIRYDPDTTVWLASSGKYKKVECDFLAYNPPTFRGQTRGGWAYLPGTKKEASQVADKLAKDGNDTTTFTGVNALEESFYSLSGNNSPSIIHISTHGFYYPDTVSDEYRKNMMFSASGDIQFKYADDPLLRSGLIMAGGNNTWKGLPRPEGVEDGILTAREVSNMNLLNTELVVLSACQTGQGDVKGSEGVEGLQRGFKMAGVHFLIMSLWEVPDKETAEFMEHLYSLWPGGDLSIRDAFRETQLRMMHKYPGEPHKWAGFVLME